MSDEVTLAEPFVRPEQQARADFMGMYIFLGTETMLFGALFAVVFAYRMEHAAEAAEAARHLRLWLATGNTAILLTSSLMVALAVHAGRAGARRHVAGWLGAAMALGVAFLALKGIEYAIDYRDGLMPLIGDSSPVRDGPAGLFLDLYFAATGLHAVHMTVGLCLLAWTAVRTLRGAPPIVVEMSGLYWHFVDVVWVFILPIFYLARG